MKKTKLTRSLLAACSIVALSVALSGCLHSSDDPVAMDDTPATTPPDTTPPERTPPDTTPPDTTPPDTTPPEEDTMMPEEPEARGPNPAAGHLIAGAIGDMPRAADIDDQTDGAQMPFTGVGRVFTTTHTLDATEGTQTDPVPDDEMFAMSMDAPAMIEGWQGSMHTRMMADDEMTMDADESFTDMVVSYTNEEDMTAEVWATYFGGATRTGVQNANVDATTGSISLENDQSMNHMNVVADFGLSAGNQNVPLPIDDPDTTETETDPREFDGSFYGVDGTFMCSANCAVTSDSMGNLNMLTGTWTFVPTVAEGSMLSDVMVPGVVRDDDYLTFGYWIRSTNDGEDGAQQYAFSAFHGGAQDYGTVASVVGTAEYSGSATGIFMTKMFDPNTGMPIPIDGGQFTATASLTASFGQPAAPDNNIPPSELNTVTGTIGNFLNDAGEMIDDEWVATLTGTNHAHADNTGDAGTFSGTTEGDMGAGAGAFSGTFHGDNTDNDNLHPAAATGIFNAHFDNGHVSGAFGATLDEE